MRCCTPIYAFVQLIRSRISELEHFIVILCLNTFLSFVYSAISIVDSVFAEILHSMCLEI
jgi:hypothetical protein